MWGHRQQALCRMIVQQAGIDEAYIRQCHICQKDRHHIDKQFPQPTCHHNQNKER